jgi:hypothetical protein
MHYGESDLEGVRAAEKLPRPNELQWKKAKQMLKVSDDGLHQ